MKIIYSVAVFVLMLVGLDSFADSLEQFRIQPGAQSLAQIRRPVPNFVRAPIQPIGINPQPSRPRPVPNFVRAFPKS